MHLNIEAPNAQKNQKREVLDSRESDFVTKRCCSQNKLPKDEQRTTEASDHCRWRVLMLFENHHLEHLETKYLNNSKRDINVVKEELNIVLLEAMNGDKFAEDR